MQPECPWLIAKRKANAAKERAQAKRKAAKQETVNLSQTKRRAVIQKYNEAVDEAKTVLKGASEIPGEMTPKQEEAQRNIINAWLKINPY